MDTFAIFTTFASSAKKEMLRRLSSTASEASDVQADLENFSTFSYGYCLIA
jgi:hypothetical protein